jgi:hypothetical protein
MKASIVKNLSSFSVMGSFEVCKSKLDDLVFLFQVWVVCGNTLCAG